MEPQPIIGYSMDALQGILQSRNQSWDPRMLQIGIDVMLIHAYDSLPSLPAYTTAPLSHAAATASWVPDGADRIGHLPDPILRDVISRLPVKDAARTAVLASRWRSLWRSAPLVLDDIHLLTGIATGPAGRPRIGDETPGLADAVSRVLATHPGPFRSVHLTCSAMEAHRGEVARWLDALAAKAVQELAFINRPWPLDIRLPATLFRCASLTRLHLGVWKFPDTAAVPRSAAFPNLRELGLFFINMDERDLAFLLDRCPVLETLTMILQIGVSLRLVSRTVRCLQLCMTKVDDVAVVDAPRLDRFLLFMSGMSKTSRIKIGRAPNLRVLGYLEPREHVLEIGNTVISAGTKESPSTVVPSVKILGLEVKFAVRNEVKKVPSFLRCFPNLETLHVKSATADEATGKASLKLWKEGGPITCVLRHMKKLVFHEFQGLINEIVFLKFIAENARFLEKMVIVVAYACYSSGEDVNSKLKPLTCAKWVGGTCKLQVFKSPFEGTTGGPVYDIRLASEFSQIADPFDLIYYRESL
ncbi:FBD-associated F-box protein At5g60610-like [Lolium perenne]|uniref:FBD-associated F-box protein At5g60610-like n=1 Tax=Lolium perenne TaxID=4522 RepID=UPI0021E9FB5C|nr:FBD-associated F-box protein At5g60610-like [Lolium perenne]